MNTAIRCFITSVALLLAGSYGWSYTPWGSRSERVAKAVMHAGVLGAIASLVWLVWATPL